MHLRNLAEIRTGLVLSRCEVSSSAPANKVFTLSSVGKYEIDGGQFNELKTITTISANHLSQIGDVVIRLSYPNYSAPVTSKSEGVIVPSQLAVIRLKSTLVSPKYLSAYLNSDMAMREMAKLAEGTSIRSLSLAQLAEFDIPIPPSKRQEQIVALHELMRKQSRLMEELTNAEQKRNGCIIRKILKGETK